MEAIMALNAKRSGHNGLLKVDKENCPTFGFGNGSTNRCTATVQLAIRADEKPGSLTVHCLDQGTGPLLLSVDTLRRLKAVIDFESDLVCFRALDAKRLVPVERSQTGHQLLPMTEDLFENSLIAKSAVTSFRDLVQIKITNQAQGQPLLRGPHNMPRTTKADLQAELLELGEEVPNRWTRMEIEQRLRELRNQGLADSEEPATMTEMETMNKELRKAARKKATLVTYCTETLGMTLTGNETMAVLESKALTAIMKQSSAEGGDYVGFGSHSKERYITIHRDFPDYAQWVKTTYRESGDQGVDHRLARLAKWLEKQPAVPTKPPPSAKSTGYLTATKDPPVRVSPPRRGTSTARGSTDAAPNESDKKLAMMAETLELLRAEIAEVRAERPRKTVAKADEDMTDSSFSMVSESPQQKPERKKMKVRDLSAARARSLEEQGWSIVPQLFQTLVGHNRTGEQQNFLLLIDEGVKQLMGKLHDHDPEATPEQLLSMAVSTFNQRELEPILNDAVAEFKREAESRAVAEKALVDWQAQQRPKSQAAISGNRGRDKVTLFGWSGGELIDSLSQTDSTPWTFTKLTAEIGGNQYEDISDETPPEEEWNRAQDVTQELQPSRVRIRGKRQLVRTDTGGDTIMDEPSEPSQPSRIRRTFDHRGPRPWEAAAVHWSTVVQESAWATQEVGYWTDDQAAVEVAVDLPDSQRGWDHFCKNPQAYLVSMLKRRAVEVSEKRLSAEDRQKFAEAKQKEVRNFISANAFEALPKELQPSKDQAIGMRWLLTWKVQEDGSVKPKARAILLGYQDPQYEYRSTTAPVMTRQTRQLFLQAAANLKWRIQKGDISGAFLQGRDYPDELFCSPCDEILEAMKLPKGSITRLKRACYGLVDAPLEWYKTVAEFMESIGLVRLWSDACAWVWKPQGELRGMVTGHVDDFMFGGADSDAGWQEIIRRIKERFRWGDWDQVSLRLSEVCESTVDTIVQTNQLLDYARQRQGAAESQAAVNGEDSLFYVRYQWAEMFAKEVDLRNPSNMAAQVGGSLITDSRNVYDKLHTAVLTIQGAEKKSNLELLSVKESQLNTGLQVRWVHSEAQLANALTKRGAKELELYYKMNFTWRIVEDPDMQSARRRRQNGLTPFEQTPLPISECV
ncbi:RE1 [Symbiodinium sp. KB8]|nr:RE1 [Symbiodinium sp. KB8]